MSLGDQIAACGGRRFFLTCGASAIYTVLFGFGMLTEGGYITLQMATVGAYIAANVVQKYNESKNGNSN